MLIFQKLRHLLSGQFIRNVGWMGGAELANRIFRLGTTVVLARLFTPQDYGLVAIVLTTNEFSNVFTLKSGIGSKIIQADEKELSVISNTAYWLNWILCGSLFIIQCIAAFPIAWFYHNNELILPICVTALVYLMLPFFLVHGALIERENRLNIFALCNITQSLVGNILTIVLAVMGLGMWAIVLPIVLSTPAWLIICRRSHSWRAPKSFSFDHWQEIARFGTNILGVELLTKVRGNIDYLIIGHFLGVGALGIYYFAFNAGLGISMNVLGAFTSALYPHLCEVRGNLKELKQRFFSSLKTTMMVMFPLIIAQSSLAPVYVPLVFGQKWISAIPILVIICLSALSYPLYSSTNSLLNAVNETPITLRFSLIYTMVFAIAILVVVKWGILWVAASVLACQLLLPPSYSIWAIRYVFAKHSSFSLSDEKS